MRISGYVLAADPAWIDASVRSYYPALDRLVVSYDEQSRSWTGSPIAVEESLQRLSALDTDGKIVLCPGRYARLDHAPLENDTYQRQCALDEASRDADWVLQLDTDEAVANLPLLLQAIEDACRRGFGGVEFPARNLYQHLQGDLFLERCRRLWQVAAAYPGPIAVRAGTQLRLCRQANVPLYRVDFAHRNTDPAHPRGAPVHRVIDAADGIFHYSWVRSDEHMRGKSRSSGHAGDLDWIKAIDRWTWRRRHPRLATMLTPLRRERDWTDIHWLRTVHVPGELDAGEIG